jgi:hypothetical protein
MSEDLTNEMQWGEMLPRVSQLNVMTPSESWACEISSNQMKKIVNQMNGPLLSVNVCHDALIHSNSRCAHHSLL